MSKPIIRLYASWGLGLIIEYPSGVMYSNQVGGFSCLHPELEGVFIPLFDELKGEHQETQLLNFFTGNKWMGNCARGIDAETADFVDEVLIQSVATDVLRVDRQKLAQSCEAWVHVKIGEHIDTDLRNTTQYKLSSLSSFYGKKGVLTWANSD